MADSDEEGETLLVEIPEGVGPGELLIVTAPSGIELNVRSPRHSRRSFVQLTNRAAGA